MNWKFWKKKPQRVLLTRQNGTAHIAEAEELDNGDFVAYKLYDATTDYCTSVILLSGGKVQPYYPRDRFDRGELFHVFTEWRLLK